MEKFSIKIEKDETARRLDKFLALKFPDYSRNYFQQLTKKGKVSVNGKIADQDFSLKAGDVVRGEFEAPAEISVEADSSIKFKVIHDAAEFAVIEKPAGLVVHPSYTHKSGTLVNGLLARWPEMANVGENAFRSGIVHRLDKETSGLMVIAKAQPMYLWLKRQFHDRLVEKRYTTLVAGKMMQKEGEITASIARRKTKQVAVPDANKSSTFLQDAVGSKKVLDKGFSGNVNKSRNASTGFKVLALYEGFTLIEALPKTGRMHQIRVHFKHIGHPVAGDKKYASGKALRRLPLGRHFLHASYLAFTLPSGEKVEFSSDLPPDLKKVLSGLDPLS